MKIIINVFLYLYLLVIKPFNLLSAPCQCFGQLQAACCVQNVLHTNTCFFKVRVVSSHREASGQVCIYKKSIGVPQIL